MADSATQQPPPAPPTRSVAELAAELQEMKRAKIWWWQRDDILKARMSTAVVAWVLLSIVLTICTVFRSTPSIYQFNHRLIPIHRSLPPPHRTPRRPRNPYRPHYAPPPRVFLLPALPLPTIHRHHSPRALLLPLRLPIEPRHRH